MNCSAILADAAYSLHWFDAIDGPRRTMITIIAIVAAAIVLTIIAVLVRSMYRYRLEVNFKREMVEQGKSAEEIGQIISAKRT
jgi:hypothetical protein